MVDNWELIDLGNNSKIPVTFFFVHSFLTDLARKVETEDKVYGLYRSLTGRSRDESITACLNKVGSLTTSKIPPKVISRFANIVTRYKIWINSSPNIPICHNFERTCVYTSYGSGVIICTSTKLVVRVASCGVKNIFFLCEFPGNVLWNSPVYICNIICWDLKTSELKDIFKKINAQKFNS